MTGLAAERAAALVAGMAGRRVVVVGDVMLDHFLWGEVNRISPEAPVPVVRVRRESFHPGGCGNVAANLRALGGIPLVFAPVGPDRTAETLRTELTRLGIDAGHLVEIAGRVTTKKTRIVAHQQQVVRFDREEELDLAGADEAAFIAAVRGGLDGADALVISDYDKGGITAGLLEAILPEARGRRIIVAIDPKRRHFARYQGPTLITPNLAEAAHAVGFPIRTDEDVLRAGHSIRESLAADGVLLTRGEHGMSLFERDGLITHIAATAREVFDVTGAGDTVIATAVLALTAGASLREAAFLANRAAGIAIGKIGTATVRPDELGEAGTR